MGVAIVWLIAAIMVLAQYAPLCAELPKKDKILAGIILCIVAPIICAYTAVEGLLDCILPSGWDDDDDERKM